MARLAVALLLISLCMGQVRTDENLADLEPQELIEQLQESDQDITPEQARALGEAYVAHLLKGPVLKAWDKAKTITEQYKLSVDDVYYAAATADVLGEQLDAQLENDWCKVAKAAVKSNSGFKDQAQAVVIVATTKCPGVQIPAALVDEAVKNIASDEVATAYYAVQLLAAAKAVSPSSITRDVTSAIASAAKDFLGKLSSLKTGVFFKNAVKGEASITATGQIYSALGVLNNLGAGLNIGEIAAGAAKVLAGASTQGLAKPGDDNAIEAAALFLKGVRDIAPEGQDIEKLGALAEFLVDQVPYSSAIAYWQVLGLTAVSGTSPKPLRIFSPSDNLSIIGERQGLVYVTDYLGNDLNPISVTLATLKKGKKQLLKGVPMEQTSMVRAGYFVSLEQFIQEPGAYSMSIEAKTADGATSWGRKEVPLFVHGLATAVDGAASITKQDGSVVDSFKVGASKTLTLKHTNVFKFSTSLQMDVEPSKPAPVTPKHAVLKVTSEPDGPSAYFWAKPGPTLQWTVTTEAIAKQIGTVGGEFSVTAILSDPSAFSAAVTVAVFADAAHLVVVHQPLADGSPAPPPAPSSQEVLFAPKKEIQHMFRPPAKRPPAVISLAFTVIAVLPLVVLFGLLGSAGVNFKGFPTSGPGLLYAVAFHLGIAGFLVVYLLFWTVLNLLQTLPLLAVLGVYTLVTGYLSLSTHASAKQKVE